MAKFTSGINGPFTGKVGTVVGCTWKGIPYMRALPKKRTGKVSDAEMANRKRFAQAQAWLKPLTPFLRTGFKNYSPTSEGFVAAKSYLLKNAIEAIDSDFRIIPEKMKLSVGELPLPAETAAIFNIANGSIDFTWRAEKMVDTSMQDQAMLMAYCVELGRAIFITTGAFRKSGHDELMLPNSFAGKQVEVYIAFVAADRSRQSDSIYLGSILCEG